MIMLNRENFFNYVKRKFSRILPNIFTLVFVPFYDSAFVLSICS